MNHLTENYTTHPFTLSQSSSHFNDLQYTKDRLRFRQEASRKQPDTVSPYSYYSTQIQTPSVTEPTPLYQSKNQHLAGTANPKTFIPPVVVPAIYDLSYWKKDDFTVPSGINSRNIQDYEASGYQTIQAPCKNSLSGGDYYYESRSPKTTQRGHCTLPQKPLHYDGVFNFTGGNDGISNKIPELKENYTPLSQMIPPVQYELQKNKELVNRTSYEPKNVEYNMPVNYSPFPEQFNTESINDQIFTSMIGPDLYYKNRSVEPLNSNIGISFTQQIPTTEASHLQNGLLMTTTNQPYEMNQLPVPARPIGLAESEVFDPRSNGYGSAVRCYIDEMSGQPRYFYDDVDAIRRPNYISRSNVDFLSSADTYGPMNDDRTILENNENARQNVENAFLNNQLAYRSDLMTSILRKTTARDWQRKIAPLNRANQVNRGHGMISGQRGNLVAN